MERGWGEREGDRLAVLAIRRSESALVLVSSTRDVHCIKHMPTHITPCKWTIHFLVITILWLVNTFFLIPELIINIYMLLYNVQNSLYAYIAWLMRRLICLHVGPLGSCCHVDSS